MGEGSIPGQGTTTAHAVWLHQKINMRKEKPRLALRSPAEFLLGFTGHPSLKRSQEGALAGHLVILNKISMSDCEEGGMDTEGLSRSVCCTTKEHFPRLIGS